MTPGGISTGGGVTRESYKQAKHAAYRGDINAFSQMFADIVRPANPTRVFLIAGWEQALTDRSRGDSVAGHHGYRSPRTLCHYCRSPR